MHLASYSQFSKSGKFRPRIGVRMFTPNKREQFVLIQTKRFYQSLEKGISEKILMNCFMLFLMTPETTHKTNIDIGKAIRQKMSEQGTTTAWLARQVGCDRSNLGKQLRKRHVAPDLLLKISRALKIDFFALYSCTLTQTA